MTAGLPFGRDETYSETALKRAPGGSRANGHPRTRTRHAGGAGTMNLTIDPTTARLADGR